MKRKDKDQVYQFEAVIEMPIGVGFAAVRGFIRPVGGATPSASTATVTSLSPNTDAGNKTISLTVNGTGFVAGMQVLVDGSTVPSTYVSATQVTVPNFSTGSVGTHTIRVLKSGELPSNGQTFTSTTPASSSTVTTLTPNTDTDTKTISLTVNGTGFNASTQVLVDSAPVIETYVSPTQIVVPSFATGATGNRAITVQNPGELVSNTVNFVTTSSAPVLPVTAGLLGWYDAADDASFTYGGATDEITQWKDKSVNGYHANAPGTSGRRPKRDSTTLINGLKSVFIKDDNGGWGRNLNTSMPADAVPCTVMAAFSVEDTATSKCILGTSLGTQKGFHIDIDANEKVTTGAQAWQDFSASTSAVAINTPVQIGVIISAVDTYAYWINRVAAGNGTETLPPSGVLPNGLTTAIGSSTGATPAGNNWAGRLCEIIKYNRVLNTTERQQVEAYLKTKWGTP